MSDDKPVDRRRFFRAGLAELLKPLAQVVAPFEEAARQIGRLEDPRPAPVISPEPQPAWLRPPGALDDESFRATCSRGGECVKACPATAIKIDRTGQRGDGAPYINPNDMACVLCDGLHCMSVCKSGALQPTPLVEIDMGTARWEARNCVRKTGEDCRICVEACPIGDAALTIIGNLIHVRVDGCTGCGVCQQVCPTDPKALLIIPKSAR